MTRKEEILKAARAYVDVISFSSPSDVIHFENGAKWADEHPNLEKLWHDASEEPKGVYQIMCQDKFAKYWLTDYYEDKEYNGKGWKECVECECIVRWTYISDLLPKGGNDED